MKRQRSGIMVEPRYRRRTDDPPQQITRIPAWRPEMWVRLADDAGEGLAGKVLQVRSLTCAITHPDQPCARWSVHLKNGRSVPAWQVEREATAAEIAVAERRSHA